jgi:hypothetical protein
MEGKYGNPDGNKTKGTRTIFPGRNLCLTTANLLRKWSSCKRVESQGPELPIETEN